MLMALVLIPLLTAAAVSVMGKARAYPIALLGTLLPVGVFAWVAGRFEWVTPGAGRYQLESSWSWSEELGLRLSVGVDSLSMLLIALTVLLGPVCVAASRTAVTRRVKTYYFWLLVLQAAVTGVFMARDVIAFYVFFEFTLVPMFVLISLFGSSNRKAAAIKFFLYTFTGSVLALAGLVYVAWFNSTLSGAAYAWDGAGRWTFDLAALQNAGRALPAGEQMWVFAALMAGFAVKVPLFPLHTWLPLAHTEAPTAGSVVLAGVLLKLGTYGILAVAVPMAPRAAVEASGLVALLSVTGIVVAGLICWVQTDVKKLVAYSSVAHLGFCMLGMFAFNAAGLQGSILYMINHGLSTGAMFLLIGMIYERYHTRSMKELGGLAAKMPVWSTFMVFFTMASVGLPGLNGFISEFLCLLGAFQAGDDWPRLAPGSVAGTGGSMGPYLAAVAGTGMIIAAIYLLYMLGRVVWGPLVEPHGHDSHGGDGGHGGHAESGAGGGGSGSGSVTGSGSGDEPCLPADLSLREILVLAPLAVLCLAGGLYPRPALAVLDTPVRETIAVIDAARAARAAAASEPGPAASESGPAASPPAAEAQR